MAEESEREKDREMLAHAAALRAPLAKAGKLAASNGSGYLAAAVLSVLFSLSTSLRDLIALGVAAVLVYVGVQARRLGPRLAAGDGEAARSLSRNELLLFGAIATYCVLVITVVPPVSSEVDELLRSAGTQIDLDRLTRMAYVTVAIVSLLYQGGLAWHFRKQADRADEYVFEVPQWARDTVASLPG